MKLVKHNFHLETIPTLKKNPIQRLILKNCQAMTAQADNNYVQRLDLAEALCPLGSTLQDVDLSFNDMMAIFMNASYFYCLPHLRSFDVSFNLLAAISTAPSGHEKSLGLGYLFMFTCW